MPPGATGIALTRIAPHQLAMRNLEVIVQLQNTLVHLYRFCERASSDNKCPSSKNASSAMRRSSSRRNTIQSASSSGRKSPVYRRRGILQQANRQRRLAGVAATRLRASRASSFKLLYVEPIGAGAVDTHTRRSQTESNHCDAARGAHDAARGAAARAIGMARRRGTVPGRVGLWSRVRVSTRRKRVRALWHTANPHRRVESHCAALTVLPKRA